MEEYFYFPTALETVVDLESGSPSPRRRVPCNAAAAKLRRHYLDACFRCGRVLAGDKDIFMYRGDTPFCSEECRQRQIDADEASEMKKRSKQPAATRREQQQQRQRQSPQAIPVWAR
ncbi:hypothetical protein GUJ93_ZPchr0006g45953 [Zizania palustris]|uniref:FLZ-type domain-containing protein n=1 Tax=Zizania palustris TaxID=103762 RepID=A0A8J5SLP1_ZIZPA|nr:hypothetical protein GUJ93_ZPchr0006g45953 [Zizania palustris]